MPVDAASISVVLPDGARREVPTGTTVGGLAEAISRGLAKKAVAGRVNGELVDLSRGLADGDSVAIVTSDDRDALEVLRHSAAHLMAMAVQKLYPGAMVTIGPVTDDGFFYDFDYARGFTPEDLAKIEKEMAKLAEAKHPVTRTEIAPGDVAATAARFRAEGEPYKAEILEDIVAKEPGAVVTVYGHGGWSDLCRGPHVPNTGWIKHVKLLSTSGAYWRGSEKNKMLQRIYATAYFSEADLKAHLHRLEEASKRDHRKLGKELDLFSVSDVTGPGLILWHPNGAIVRGAIEEWLRGELKQRGYLPVYTPHVVKETLFQISGHLENYSENMYGAMVVDEENYRAKPMNCPGHSMIYKSQLRSYRDLPIRLQEFATVYRYERSGTLHGLARVRGLTQDDGHTFCTLEQLGDEIAGCVEFVLEGLRVFGLEAKVYLSTRPEKAIGEEMVWEKATAALRGALDRCGLDYEVDEGGGAFYGPKIDFKFYDAIGREWQGPTVQCDFNLPERFDLTYRGSDGGEHRPVMVHRAILGTFERFMALVIEHFAGAFPLWMAPVQASIIPISDEAKPFAEEIHGLLKAQGFRAELDDRNESLNYRIRDAQVRKVPYMFVLGKQEVEARSVAVRARAGGRQRVMPLDEALRLMGEEQATKSLVSLLVPVVQEASAGA